MSVENKVDRFYAELRRFAQERFRGNAYLAAAELGISNNRLTDAGRGRRPKPHAATLMKCIARGDEGLVRAAQDLLDTYDRKADPYFIVTDPPPELAQLLGEGPSARVMSYSEFRRLAPPQAQSPSAPRDLPNLIKRYTHAALQLETGAFGNGVLALGLDQDTDLGNLEAYAIVDLIHAFVDLRYFRSLTAALREGGRDTTYHILPVHPFQVIELATIMREPALPTESEELKVLRSLTKEDGRNTAFIFYEHNDKRPRDTPKEIISLVETFMTQPLGLYSVLTPEFKTQRCELPEPTLVCAAASVAAMRLTLSLMAATRTLVGLGQKSTWLDAVVSKTAELSREAYPEVVTRMGEALDILRDDEAELDRSALEREVALSITALFREQGAWFMFNSNEAFLSKCGSVLLGSALRGELGKEKHRFLESRHSCKLPDAPRRDDPIWIFRGAAGISLSGKNG